MDLELAYKASGSLEPILFRVKDARLIPVTSKIGVAGRKVVVSGKETSTEVTEEHVAEEEKPTSEVPNIITLLHLSPLKDKPWVKTLVQWENPFFSLVPVLLMTVVVVQVYRRRKLIPGRLQNAIELIVEIFDNFICEVMGKENGRRFMPYIGSLFLFIFFNNLMGIVPFMKSPTSSYRTTLALALCTFFYVQYVAVTKLGVLGYIRHLAGDPQNIIMWLVAPLMLPMHIIGEIAKVISLSLRLFGNVFGEDTLIGVFALIGIMLLSIIGVQAPVVGLPLQLPFMFLAMLTGFVQALVFALLSMIYFILVLPEEGH